MTFLFALLLRWGVPLKVARPLAYLIAAIALVGLLWGAWTLWLSSHDRGVVRDDRANAKVEALQADRSATRAADAADAKAEAEARAEAENIERDIAHATASHPEEVRRPAGPAVSAVTDRLRNRAR